ncbi:MAG: cysteine desulfurase, partial [Firmicutes bacterium HGW-Firmicutes-13]
MIYMDNAATTWPKPETVYRAADKFMREIGANPGRGGHKSASRAGEIIAETRKKLSGIFNINDPNRLVFTPNATYSINTALKGLLREGDHVVATFLEHNSTLRPLYKLFERGIKISIVACSPEGFIEPGLVKKEIKKNTKLVCLNHASNVLGTITPVKEIGSLVRERGPFFLVDAAQTAGLYPIDVEEMKIDLLAFPGHKSLLGPQGTGGLYVREGLDLESLVEGGTGSHSEYFEQPDKMPDKLESGTPNTSGIAGLGAGIDFILQEGMDKIRIHEL